MGAKITTEIAYEGRVQYAIYRYQRPLAPLAPSAPQDPPSPPQEGGKDQSHTTVIIRPPQKYVGPVADHLITHTPAYHD